jgi:hypothetical protein
VPVKIERATTSVLYGELAGKAVERK